MKKSILVSSFLTIALCLSVLIGSTFALFTSEDKVNIAVTSGKVEVEATISNLKTYSMDVEQAAGTFENGGVATLTNGELFLDKVTPGDKVTFTIAIDNRSNVNIKYRTVVYCIEGTGLLNGLSIKIGTETITGSAYTPWTALVANEDIADLAVSVELPKEAGNEYQNKTAKLLFVVEAVQANGVDNATVDMPDLIVPGTTIELTKRSDPREGGVIDLNSPEDFKYLPQLLANWKTITGTQGYDNYYYKWAWDIELNCDVDLANELWTPVDLNGLVFDGNNHVIKNLNVQAGDYAALFSKATNISNLHIENANIKGGNMTAVVAAHATGSYENITATNITVNGGKYVGGLFAKAYGNIVNCHVKGENNVIVATDKEVGGIVGFLTSGEGKDHTAANVVKDCSVANLQITGTEEVGGVIGRAYTYHETTITITATTSNVVVTATNAVYHGQILGRDYDGNGVTIN